MKQNRILPLLGPALVLYLMAEVASTGDGLSTRSAVLATAALLLSLLPLWLRRRPDQRGIRRTALLSVAAATALIAQGEAALPSLTLHIAAAFAAPLAGLLVADLALASPDRIRALRNLRLALPVLAMSCAGAGVLAMLPPFTWLGHEWIFPARLATLPPTFTLVALSFALAVRLARSRLGSTPEALASNAWALMGLVPAALCAFGYWLLRSRLEVQPAALTALLAGTAAGVVYGHLALVDPARRLRAGAASRRIGTFWLTVGLLALGARALPELPGTRLGMWLLLVAGLGAAALLERLLSPLTGRLLAPYGGRLLRAADDVRTELAEARTLTELGQALLPQLREASGSITASPLLYTTDPPVEVRIDAAAIAHSSARAMPEALAERLREHPGEPVVTSRLLGLLVRRPDLRDLIETLTSLDALAVLPLHSDDLLEGALVIPKGARRSSLSLEEYAALRDLGGAVSAAASRFAALARSEARAGALTREKERLGEGNGVLEEEVARLREESRALVAGRGAGRKQSPSVSYSPSMRSLEADIERVSRLPGCVHLLAEGGVPVDRIAAQIHARSPRADGPLLVIDCAAARPEAALGALLGDAKGTFGWLRLARGGTLLLADIPALGLAAEHALAEALAKRKARPQGGRGAYEVDVRVVASSRVALEPLARDGRFDAKLMARLSALSLEAPPLRERLEDIPSLTLLAIDRACRLLGKPTVGIEDAALAKLLDYAWPGNLREFTHVLDRAVASTTEAKIRLADLPPLGTANAPSADDASPLAGNFTDIERRILSTALERAGGNKSEAARNLGLKRTTFLDKLRRLGLEQRP